MKTIATILAGCLAFLASAAPAAEIRFSWEPSVGVVGYRLHSGGEPACYTNVVFEGVGTNATLTRPMNTTYYAVTAVGTNGLESGFSNEVAVKKVVILTNTVVTVRAELAAAISGPWTNYGTIFQATNPEPRFWRLCVVSTNL